LGVVWFESCASVASRSAASSVHASAPGLPCTHGVRPGFCAPAAAALSRSTAAIRIGLPVIGAATRLARYHLADSA